MNRTRTSDISVNRGSTSLGKAARNSRAILLFIVILVTTMKVPVTWAIPFANEDLGGLSNRELLTELETRGLKVKNLACRTLLLGHSFIDATSPLFSSYTECRNEVERRGLAIEDELLEMLHREIKLDRGTDSEQPHFPITLAGELLSLIERFHTRKTASSLLVILEADQPSAPENLMSAVRLPCYPDFFEAHDQFGNQAAAKEFSAVEWVTKHAEQLQYDSIRHALFLPDAAQK